MHITLSWAHRVEPNLRMVMLMATLMSLVTASSRQALPSNDAAARRVPVGFRVLGTTIPPDAEDVAIPASFAERRPETNRTLPKLSAVERRKGYVLFTKNWMDPVYPDTCPLKKEITNRVELSSVPGGYEPATFAIHALTTLNGVKVIAGDLEGPQGSVIPACNIDVRYVRCLPRWVDTAAYAWLPSLAEKRTSIDIDKGTTQQFWVTIWVPPDSTPGQYRGTIHIRPSGLRETSLQLRLRVLSLRLLTPPTLHGMYYTAVDLESGPQFRSLPVERLRKDILNMKEHGMNTVFISIPPVCEAFRTDRRIRFDVKPLRPLMGACQEAGFKSIVWNTTLTELIGNPLGDFPTLLASYVAECTAQGWPRLILSVGDESDANRTLEQVLRMLAQVKQALPEMTTYTTIVFPENSELYGKELDIRAFSSYVDDSIVEKTKKAGAQLWMYSGTSGYGLDPVGDRLYRGVWASKLGLAGVLQWTYWRPIDSNQPFNDLIGSRNNLTCWVFPGKDGPLPSIGWEAAREGIEDEKYLFTLTDWIRRARQSGDRDIAALADDAQKYLSDLYAKVDTSPRTDNAEFPIRRACAKLGAKFFRQFRRQTAWHIKRLQRALAGGESNL